MRPFEWLLVGGTLGTLAVLGPWSWQVRGRWRWRLGYPAIGAAGTGLILHVVVEGTRWQLTVVYVTIAAMVLAALRHPLRSQAPPAEATMAGPLARGLSGLTAVVLVLSGVAAWALPVPSLGEPVGPWNVGTRTFDVTDTGRIDSWSPNPTDARRFPVQVWYPTNDSEGQRAPVTTRPDVLWRAAAAWLGLPTFALSHLDLVTTSAILNAPLAVPTVEPWPVLIYSHSWGGFRAQHLSLLEGLAATGHVVFAIDHTFGGMASVFADGHAETINRETLPSEPESAYTDAAVVLIETYARDMQSLAAQLRDDEIPIPISSTDLATNRVGLIGHSSGGGAAMLACSRMANCGLVIGFDPWVDPVPDDVLSSGLSVPVVTLRTSEWAKERNDANLRRIHASSAQGRLLLIADGVHKDFSMASALTPLARQVGLTGATGGERVRQIAEELTREVVSWALRDGSEPALDWPEVTQE